jgi:type VI secretion system protein ImpA
MAAPPLFDLDELLEPIPGSDPAGSPSVFYEIKSKLDEMRREVFNPEELPEDDPDRQKRADWVGLEKLARDTLKNRAKDLRVVNYLVLALVRQHGFVGLRDGLRLLIALIEICWDRLLPAIDEESTPLDRVLPLENSLDDPVGGFRLPTALHMVLLLQGKKQSFSYLDWEFLQKPEYASHPRRAELEEAFPVALTEKQPEWVTAASEVIEECLQERVRLAELLKKQVGGEAPGLLKMRDALVNCQRMARMVLEKTQPARPADESKTDIPADGRPGTTAAAGPVASRAEAYRLLAEAATTLERLEPHSPIPYLVRRAVELGSLPFPQLIKALIRDGNVLAELSRELGLKDGESQGD